MSKHTVQIVVVTQTAHTLDVPARMVGSDGLTPKGKEWVEEQYAKLRDAIYKSMSAFDEAVVEALGSDGDYVETEWAEADTYIVTDEDGEEVVTGDLP